MYLLGTQGILFFIFFLLLVPSNDKLFITIPILRGVFQSPCIRPILCDHFYDLHNGTDCWVHVNSLHLAHILWHIIIVPVVWTEMGEQAELNIYIAYNFKIFIFERPNSVYYIFN